MSSKLSKAASVTFTIFGEKRTRIDSLVRLVLKELNTPGIAVGFVTDRKIVFTKGYGLRDHSDPQSQVTARTLFGIGSCTKAFTAYVLARLVDERQLAWNDPVIKYVPEFRLDRLHETYLVTIKDLVTHATGLPTHDAIWRSNLAGSPGFVPNFTVDEFLKRLPHLETACSARQHLIYNNLMFGVAGRVIERVSKRVWRESVRDLIFQPLGMARSYCSIKEAQLQLNDEDIAKPHRYDEDASCLITYPDWIVIPEGVEAAGSIFSTAEDMAKWIQLQLSGRVPYEMHIPHMPIGKGRLPRTFDDSIFAQGLGWLIGDRNGRKFLTHSGQASGFHSCVVLFPGERMGIVVLANLKANEEDPPANWLAFRIADILTGRTSSDDTDVEWVSKLVKRARDVRASFQMDDSAVRANRLIHRPEEYVGQFEDAAYGVLRVMVIDSRLLLLYNNMKYRLYQKRGANFFSARSPTPNTYLKWNQFECAFERDSWGHVCACRMSFQPSQPPIRFVKKPGKDLCTAQYLELFVGVYGNPLEQSIRVSLNDTKGVLSLRARDAPTNRFLGELQPYKRDWFRFGSVGFEFVVKDGTVSKLIIHIGETVSILTKKDN